MTGTAPTSRSRPAVDLSWVFCWLAAFWGIEMLDLALQVASMDGSGRPTRSLDGLGVAPREPWGLVGVVFAPFLHADFQHLIHNSWSFLITGMLACRYGRRLAFTAACVAEVYAGLLTWLIGEPGKVHVGASGVIFGLIGFVLINAIVRRGCLPLVLGLVVLLLYGTQLLVGIVPNSDLPISWQMHLGGLIGGVSAGWWLRHRRPV
ncbi:MAG TPA: rhomboid family intramembrane serine protease [Planctomycetota bacterium]|nr:rhomboid family intramembrane serine protease [Planctomycetota bacterium]